MATSKNVAAEFFGATTDVSNEVVERGLMIRSAGARKTELVYVIKIFKHYLIKKLLKIKMPTSQGREAQALNVIFTIVTARKARPCNDVENRGFRNVLNRAS